MPHVWTPEEMGNTIRDRFVKALEERHLKPGEGATDNDPAARYFIEEILDNDERLWNWVDEQMFGNSDNGFRLFNDFADILKSAFFVYIMAALREDWDEESWYETQKKLKTQFA